MDYVEIHLTELKDGQADWLIAQLTQLGFEGFEELENALKAYVSAGVFNQNEFENLIKQIDVKYSTSIIKQTNWNQNWESNFEPIQVDIHEKPFAYLRANFHDPHPTAPYDLLITPKMSFGTGHHATTYQMIEQMSAIDFSEKRVIDFGTGTGVLSILAEKMGAISVLAIDNDDWSIENTRENIAANHCHRIEVLQAETCVHQDLPADVVLANINLNIIIQNLPAIKASCKKGGIVLFSGFLTQDEPVILAAIQAQGFTVKNCLSRNNWLVISCLDPE